MEAPEVIGSGRCDMARRSTRSTRARSGAGPDLLQRRAIVHSSLYLSEPVYEALRKIAFDERIKIHDLAMEGIDAVLRKRGYPSAENLKAGMKA
jgi:DNA helicase TIP49 (TBP-interacting protein)